MHHRGHVRRMGLRRGALAGGSDERDEISHNPAAGIAPINRNPKGGAKPWTTVDLKAFKNAHSTGTTAYLGLTLQAFTACHIGDAIWFGREQEVSHNGQVWLER